MTKVLMPAQVDGVTKILSRAACFTKVRRVEVRHQDAEVEYLVKLAPGLAPAFTGQVQDLVAARGLSIADNELAAVLEAVLVPLIGPMEFEIELDDDVDPEDPVLPEHVTLVVRLAPGQEKKPKKTENKKTKKKTKTKTKTKKRTGLSTPDFSTMTDEEKKIAVGREEERLRSRRRRQDARAEVEVAGTRVRNGRRGYVEQVMNSKSGGLVWRPTPEGAKVMRAMSKVWGKTVKDGPALAAHLNALGLRTITGRPFTRTMVTDLARHLARWRLSSK
jgi:hypothetical protein